MSGDIGLEQPIIFYHKKMTEAKKIVLEQKGIKLAYLEINSQKVNGKVNSKDNFNLIKLLTIL